MNYKLRKAYLTNWGSFVSSQIRASFVTNWNNPIITNWGSFFSSKFRASVVTNWNNLIITNWGKCCYKLEQVLQIRETVITK